MIHQPESYETLQFAHKVHLCLIRMILTTKRPYFTMKCKPTAGCKGVCE